MQGSSTPPLPRVYPDANFYSPYSTSTRSQALIDNRIIPITPKIQPQAIIAAQPKPDGRVR